MSGAADRPGGAGPSGPGATAGRVRGRPRWGPVAVLALAVIYGVALRWWHLAAAGLWFDEGYTAWVVSLPPRQIVAAIRVDTAPPLYYLLLRAWVAVAGTGEAAMRAPSAAAATAAIGVMAAVAWRLFRDPWARAAAVALVACSFMQVAYAREVRFYAPMSLAGAVDLYLAVRCCQGRSWGWVAAAAVAWATSLWLNNVMAIDLACLAVAWLVLPGGRSVRGRLLDLTAIGTVAAAAFSPWVPTLLSQARAISADFWTRRPTGADLVDVLRWVCGVNGTGQAIGGGAVLVLAAVAVAATVASGRWRVAAALAVYGLGPVSIAFVYSRWRTSIFMDRAFIVSSVVVPLLAVVPVEATAGGPLRLRRGAGLVAALLVAVSARSAVADRLRVPSHVEDWRAACRFAASLPAADRVVVFNANEGELLYDYYARGGDYRPSSDLAGTPADVFAADPPRTMRRVRSAADLDGLRRLLDERPGASVVFVAAHGGYADPDGRTFRLLNGRLRLADRRAFDAVTVYRFAPGPAAHLGADRAGPPPYKP